jgi:hypothetical protein
MNFLPLRLPATSVAVADASPDPMAQIIADASRLRFLQAEGLAMTNEQIDRYRAIVRERRNSPTL